MVRPFDRLRKKDFTDIEKEALFRRNKGVINRVVLNRLSKTKRIVHGARSQNAQLPTILQRKATVDWDVFAKNPRLAALMMERALDKKFRGDFFGVKEGKTKALKVHKVFSKTSGESFVDFSIPDRKVPWVAKRGIRYASLEDQFTRAIQNLTKPSAKFRRAKDKDLIRRVKKFTRKRNLL